MSPPLSPGVLKSTQVTFTVKVAGKAIDDTIGVVSVDTWTAVNKVPKARIVIYDGSPATGDFAISDLATFIPGKKIEIAAGYAGGAEKAIFSGVIVKQGLEVERNEASRLVVDVVDEAIKMTLERKNALFEKTKDSDLIGKLIGASGLKKKVTATTATHKEIVQYYASDWDMMLTRAEVNGFVATVESGTVTVGKPDTKSSPVLRVEYGETMLNFQAELDAATQFASSAIKSHAWDYATQKVVEQGASGVSVKEAGNLSSAELAKVFKVKKFTQQTGGPIDTASLKAWSSAELQKSMLSKIRGSVGFAGSNAVKVGTTIELAGVGKRFNGPVYVSGVHHSIRDGTWITTAEFGLSSRWFAAEAPDIAAPDASGLLPPVQGLQTGVVDKVAKDPDGAFRVFVKLPLLQDKSKGIWARLATFYASKKVGAVFYPEKGDEVIVGFMNDDPRFAVILGSVYSKKNAPAYPPDEKNTKKAIVTQSKLELTFDDKDKIVEIKTPGKQSITLDDKAGAITIKDKNKNTVKMSSGGIALDSGSNIKITAKGNITVQAKGNLKLGASANASMEGLQVAHKAKAKFSAKGNAASEVVASGLLTLKGALVKIN